MVVGLLASGCSITIRQTPQGISPSTASTLENTPPGSSGIPTSSVASTHVPVTWANLNLTGKLVYVAANDTTAVVSVLSLD
jgi:hypothetical protein